MKQTKRHYDKPEIKVYELQQHTQLLQASLPIDPGYTNDQW